MGKKSIVGKTREELEALAEAMGEKAFRGKQLCHWIYEKKAPEFQYMTNVSKELRERLDREYTVRSSAIEQAEQSTDGTVKGLIRLEDGECIEMVLIPSDDRCTVCISSQVGCAVQCTFCASGRHGLTRNLTAGEIVEEMLHAYDLAYDFLEDERITNVVVMGIGEPLMNYENLLKAVRIINAPWGLEIGARRITISTVGLPEQVRRLAREDLQVGLAISLHATDDETRSRLVPLNKKTGVDAVLAAADEYFRETGREVTFEVVLIDGVNCSKKRAITMAKRLRDIRCNVNVIPLNPNVFEDLNPPPPPEVEEFVSTLRRWGINTNLRSRRGRDIDAACGQLRLRSGLRGDESGG